MHSGKKVIKFSKFDKLRTKAEKILKKSKKNISDYDISQVEELIQELNVHQIELEIQNDELKQAYENIDNIKNAFEELYDEAPVGYISSSLFGEVLKANSTISKMLGCDISRIVGEPFGKRCLREDAHYLH